MELFSKRTQWHAEPNRLSLRTAEWRKKGRELIDLSVTNPTRCGFHYIDTDLLNHLLHPGNSDYEPDPHGLRTARQAVIEYYARKNCEISPDQIFLTASTSEAYSFLFKLLANAGDTILAPSPSYPILEYLTGLNDIHLERYPLCYEGGWRIDLRALQEQVARMKPKAILVVHPNNPTGNLVRSDERSAIYRLAREYGTAILSDEVFLDFPLAPSAAPAESFAAGKDALTFTLSGISKIIGLPQMKLSWMVVGGPQSVREEASARLEIISDTYLSVGTPVQNALPSLLKRQPGIQAEISQRLIGNAQYLRRALSDKNEITVLNSEAGWVNAIRCPAHKTDEDWAMTLLDQQGILVHPGYFYDFQESSSIVLSLLPPPEIFQRGIAGIIEQIKKEAV